MGAVLLDLLEETKSDPRRVADIIMAYPTLLGLEIGFWATELLQHAPVDPTCLFSTPACSQWTSRHFREHYVWPLLERQRTVVKEPSLQIFSNVKGHRIRDKVYSIHSYRRAGRSCVSRPPRHGEPRPKGSRMATPTEVYKHGQWTVKRDQRPEDMPSTYNQWSVVERVAITLLCS
jgi:hypothetical protein